MPARKTAQTRPPKAAEPNPESDASSSPDSAADPVAATGAEVQGAPVDDDANVTGADASDHGADDGDQPPADDSAADPPCTDCFPGGWPGDSTSVGCHHGTWNREL